MTQTKSPALIYAETHSFSHDISHCNPLDNLVKQCYSCKRWAAHLQLGLQPEKFKDGLYSYFSDPQKDCVLNNFSLYKQLKD